MIQFGTNCLKMVVTCRSRCNQGINKTKKIFWFVLGMDIMPKVFVFGKKSCKAETNGSKMIKFGATV